MFVFSQCQIDYENSNELLYKENIDWKSRSINTTTFWSSFEPKQRKELRILYREQMKIAREHRSKTQQVLNKDTLEIRMLKSFRNHLNDEEQFSELIRIKHQIDKKREARKS